MRQIDEAAYADMLRVIERSAEAVPGGIEYIALSRYMPASAVIVDRDEHGRLYAMAAEEFIDSIPRAPVGSRLIALAGIPIVRVAAVKD